MNKNTDMKKNLHKSNKKPLFITAVLSAVSTAVILTLFAPSQLQQTTGADKEQQPLYWVAPMDANYRRDKPGLSPMGMELVPFYADGNDTPAGTVTISPAVVNNLGVKTATAQIKPLNFEIKTVGYVKYNEDTLVHLHPRVAGWIDKLYIKAEGDPVKQGEPIYSLYSPELVNAQEEYLLALGRQNQRLIQASQDRLAALQLSPKAINEIKRKGQVAQAITFYAPQTGVVKDLSVRQGFYVQPGAKILSIGALDKIWVEAEIFERQANQVSTDTPVTMTLDYLPGKTWQGQVNYIYPSLDEKTRTLKVRLVFDNQNGLLKPNMFAQVAIHAKGEQALLIPRQALIRTGSQDRVVLALGEGKFRSVLVKVGRFDDSSVEILSGIDDGQKIVTSAQFLLDSESSKTADFARMDAAPASNPDSPAITMDPGMGMDMDMKNNSDDTAWVVASINSVTEDKVNLNHDPIPKWNWPAMTMDFSVATSVDSAQLATDKSIRIEIEKTESGSYQIIQVQQLIPENSTMSMSNSMSLDNAMPMDHSNHKMPMDNSMPEQDQSMDHQSMGHATVEDKQ